MHRAHQAAVLPAERHKPVPAIETVEVICPRCGRKQPQPRTAYSTICPVCHEHFRMQEAPQPAPLPAEPRIGRRQVTCFQCGSELDVPLTAASSMCKRCSSHVDLTDYHVTKTLTKSFRTHGRLLLDEKGYLLNTEAIVGDAVIKGRLIGRLIAKRTLEVHSTSVIKGTFTAGCFVVPAGHRFYWPEPIKVGGADIGGELVAALWATGIVRLRSSARLFGDVHAAGLVVEAGAVFVGSARTGRQANSKGIGSQPIATAGKAEAC